MSKESVAKTLHQWEQILAASDANGAELSHLKEDRLQLQKLATKVRRLREQQAALAAKRQQVTRDLDAAKAKGRDIAVRLRNGVRSQYGLKGEKLTEFGLRPRRGRRRGSKGETPPKEG